GGGGGEERGEVGPGGRRAGVAGDDGAADAPVRGGAHPLQPGAAGAAREPLGAVVGAVVDDDDAVDPCRDGGDRASDRGGLVVGRDDDADGEAAVHPEVQVPVPVDDQTDVLGFCNRKGDTMAAGGGNKVILIGNLGAAPELSYPPKGQAVCDIRLATNESWTDKSGQRQERTEWHRVVFWGKPAEICKQYLTKGQKLYVEGRLQTRTWDDKD